MTLRRELDRLKNAFRRREEGRQNLLYATVVDTSPHTDLGYVVARLVDDTVINVRAWTPVALAVGQQIIVAPIGEQVWNWYALVQVNASTNIETTPYVQPQVSGISAHALGGSLHTGSLPWSRIDTSASKVQLGSQVAGTLPTANQAKQTRKVPVTIATGSINASATASGSASACRAGYVRKVKISGGSEAKLIFRETPAGNIEYETFSVTTPFEDPGGWFHLDESGGSQVHWAVTNNGASAASFTIELQLICWEL